MSNYHMTCDDCHWFFEGHPCLYYCPKCGSSQVGIVLQEQLDTLITEYAKRPDDELDGKAIEVKRQIRRVLGMEVDNG